MGKLVSFHVVTADGYYEGPNQEFDWPVVDDEFNVFAVEQLRVADALVFGRLTYDGMAEYWPTQAADQDDAGVAGLMNNTPKLVVSTTMERADWANTRVVSDSAEFKDLRDQATGDLLILGSSDLTVRLIEAGLVDEVRIMVHPVVLGAGRSLFRTATGRIGLALLRTRRFDSGNVLLTYRPTAA